MVGGSLVFTFLLVLLQAAYTYRFTIHNFHPDHRIWHTPQMIARARYMARTKALEQALLTESDASLQKKDKIRFFLYTWINPYKAVELETDNYEALARSTFSPNHPTRFMIHGWNGRHTSRQNYKILDAVFNSTHESRSNLILVDWSVYGETLNYFSAQSGISDAGKVLAEFIDWMHDSARLSFRSLTLIGHSLGAHVVGFAGKYVKRGRIHTIIGLDPAILLFGYNNNETRLASTDAEYVETVTTSGGLPGFYEPIGKAAFFPNGGRRQPGCGVDIGGSCAHERAVDYYAEAIKLGEQNHFYTIGCMEFEDVKSATCDLNTGRIRLGDPRNAELAKGIYYMDTNHEPPYGKGNIYKG